ncbi:MAG TPA: 4-alpha-glucanotransferase [Vicinamibacteria bacterium]|nr:4-alpha-glucanotransferase [Vicinamibacteria bacterium]
MKVGRTSGILLHPTSLPGRWGIGDLGPEAFAFIEFLHEAGQGLWQVLPLGPTGYGDSPYQCFSAFAGNPLLVSLDRLREDGLLSEADLAGAPDLPAREVDYGRVIDFKLPLLQRAWEAFRSSPDAGRRAAFEEFCRKEARWLDDYALFMVVKEAHGMKAWPEWPADIRGRGKEALERWRREHEDAVRARMFWQYLFFSQWREVHSACRERGIRLMGDIPIFVAHDSADVWSHPDLFRLHEDGRPEVVAGVPPDYFSATGQLWGNPIYRWEEMERRGFDWWIDRFRSTLEIVDVVRVDHFRGFEAYWEVPAGEPTAVNGRWVKSPGLALFEAVQGALGELPIVAENLGVITPEVEALRERFGFPGMAILQFAFGSDPQGSTFIPHNFPRNRVVYTGTHDNDTTVGWWTSSAGADSTRTAEEIERERDFARRYLQTDGSEIHWAFIRAVLSSVADLAIVPLQDVLGLGSEARMNLPGRPGGNWRWRFRWEQLTPEIRGRLRELVEIYGRTPRRTAPAA